MWLWIKLQGLKYLVQPSYFPLLSLKSSCILLRFAVHLIFCNQTSSTHLKSLLFLELDPPAGNRYQCYFHCYFHFQPCLLGLGVTSLRQQIAILPLSLAYVILRKIILKRILVLSWPIWYSTPLITLSSPKVLLGSGNTVTLLHQSPMWQETRAVGRSDRLQTNQHVIQII